MGLKVDRSTYTIDVGIDIYGEKQGTYTTQDVLNYTFIRTPIVKPCPIAILEIPMDYLFYVDLLGKYGSNQKVSCSVTVKKGDEEKKDGSNTRRPQPKELINTNNFYILNVSTNDNSPSKTNPMVRVKLLMVDTLFHNLWRFNGLNKSVVNVTAKDMMDIYSGYLYSEFGGSNTFDKEITLLDNVSSHIYRRHQFKALNDLILPHQIIMNHKPTDGFSYYFLDTFKDDGSAKKRVQRMFIELTNPSKFKTYDVTQNGHEDLAIGHAISVKAISDSEDKFEKTGDYSKMFYDWKGRYKQYNPTAMCEVEQYISGDSRGYKNEPAKGGRGGNIERYHGIWDVPIKQQKQHKDGLSLYAPDTLDKCEARYDVIKNFYRNTIESFVTFAFPELHPASMLFDTVYNMDIRAPGSYKYLPIGIVNEFRKWNAYEANYKHTGYVNFLKYI